MKPIGYWLNRTDRAITRRMTGVLAEHGLTRITWQVLNVVRDVPGATDSPGATDAAVHAALAPNADAPTLTAAVDATLADGWTTRPAPGHVALTPDGGERLAAVATRIAAFRELSMAGIAPEEYRTTVAVLERMAHNLERD